MSELVLEEDDIEVENKPAEGMSELPGATARVSPDLETFVNPYESSSSTVEELLKKY